MSWVKRYGSQRIAADLHVENELESCRIHFIGKKVPTLQSQYQVTIVVGAIRHGGDL